MRLCTFARPGKKGISPGCIEDGVVVELDAPNLAVFLARGGRRAAGYPLSDVQLQAPIPKPPSIRNFLQPKSIRARRRIGLGEFSDAPVFYFSNPAAVVGPDADVVYPEETEQLDFELEVAAVIGSGQTIAGFTILNDWSARDVQRVEMKAGLGPSKGKDFATSLGPILMTPDELDTLELEMIARVNGRVRARESLSSMANSWEEMVAHARRNTELAAGDVIASGSVGGGSILAQGDAEWLRPGDVVELEVQPIGVLRNRVVSRSTVAGGFTAPHYTIS